MASTDVAYPYPLKVPLEQRRAVNSFGRSITF